VASLTVANMRALGQSLVRDTTALATSDWLLYLNDAMHAYAALFPDDPALSGALASLSLVLNDSTKDLSVDLRRSVTFAKLTGYGTNLEMIDVGDVLRHRSAAGVTTGAPVEFGLRAKSVGATDRQLTIEFFPTADASYTLDVYGTVEPTALTGDSDLTPFGHNESRVIARMACIDAARALGRHHEPGFIESLAAALPDRVKEHYGVIERATRPRSISGKAVVS
jgi:hypothetical protein